MSSADERGCRCRRHSPAQPPNFFLEIATAFEMAFTLPPPSLPRDGHEYTSASDLMYSPDSLAAGSAVPRSRHLMNLPVPDSENRSVSYFNLKKTRHLLFSIVTTVESSMTEVILNAAGPNAKTFTASKFCCQSCSQSAQTTRQ